MREFRFNYSIPLVHDPVCGHNRFHPDIEPLAELASGETFAVDIRDGLDCQIVRDTEGLGAIEALGHPLTGPFRIADAMPGDYLEVEILSIESNTFGFTCIIEGLGLLADEFTSPFLVKWDLVAGNATSPQIPGVTIPGSPFLGVIGVAPSSDRMAEIARRERELTERGGRAFLPDPVSAIPDISPIATEGLRTIPPRENGGNFDIKQLGAGSKTYIRCDVEGGLLSVGDPHFAQGDGELCGVAIEMSARATLRVHLRKAEDMTWQPKQPCFFVPSLGEIENSGSGQNARGYFGTTGIPVTEDGNNLELDVYTAAQVAVREMIAYIQGEHGYSREQAYVLASVAADLRISSIVNNPNPVVSAILPLDIFD